MTPADAGLGSHEARLAQAEQLWLGGRPRQRRGAAACRSVGAFQLIGRGGNGEEAALALARNAARLVPGAVAEFSEPSAGWWFVASLKRVGGELGPQFAASAWPLLARVD